MNLWLNGAIVNRKKTKSNEDLKEPIGGSMPFECCPKTYLAIHLERLPIVLGSIKNQANFNQLSDWPSRLASAHKTASKRLFFVSIGKSEPSCLSR